MEWQTYYVATVCIDVCCSATLYVTYDAQLEYRTRGVVTIFTVDNPFETAQVLLKGEVGCIRVPFINDIITIDNICNAQDLLDVGEESVECYESGQTQVIA